MLRRQTATTLLLVIGLMAVLGAQPARAASVQMQRWAGSDRYGTAAAISASTYAPGAPVAYIATGTNVPDALTGGVSAARQGGPMLLVEPGSIPSATANELARLRPYRIVVLGSSGAVSDHVRDLLWQYQTGGGVTRLEGTDRYATAARISEATWTTGAAVAFVATGTNYPDAAAGVPAAARYGGPLLLTEPNAVPDVLRAELARLKPGRIFILGSSGAVSDYVAGELWAYTATDVVRIGGPDRYATAVAIATWTHGNGAGGSVFAATGSNFPDALTGGPAAYAAGAPVLLLPSWVLTGEVRYELQRINPTRIVALGSAGVVSNALVLEMRSVVSGVPALPACSYQDVLTPLYTLGDWPSSLLDTIYMLPSNYAPTDLVSTANAGLNGGYSVRSLVISDLAAMAYAAWYAGAQIEVVSGYRSYQNQVDTFNYWVSLVGYDEAVKTSARPGHSEHQLGTTLDFKSAGGPLPWDLEDWASTPAGAWMAAHAWEYGFVMTYPYGRSAYTCYSYEPWHYRYVGRALAAEVYWSGLSLREWQWARGYGLS